ncbi:MAG: hypothetical protein Q9162_000141 [Coniocarpon cinnabarinum]
MTNEDNAMRWDLEAIKGKVYSCDAVSSTAAFSGRTAALSEAAIVDCDEKCGISVRTSGQEFVIEFDTARFGDVAGVAVEEDEAFCIGSLQLVKQRRFCAVACAACSVLVGAGRCRE